MTTLSELNARALEKRIASADHPEKLLETAKLLIMACASISDHVRWALDPEEDAVDHAYWANAMVERSHEILDLAHEFRQALKEKPVDNSLQSTR